jgi:opacity protein-like surface antigen
MKKGILVASVSLVLFLVTAPVFAAGPYVGLEGGVLWLSDSSVTSAGVNEGDLSFDTGWGIGGVGGYDFGTWRVEAELAYRSSGADKFTENAGASFPLDGDVTSTALMVNAFYDFKTLSPSVYPYIGAGIGGASVAADLKESGVQVVDDDEIVFAWQLVAGVAFPVSKQLAIDLNYRYFATTDPEIKDVIGEKLEVEYGSHNIFLGLRYSF